MFERYGIIDKNGKSLKFMMKNERDCGKMIDNQELSIEYSSEIYLCNYKLSKCRYYHVQL